MAALVSLRSAPAALFEGGIESTQVDVRQRKNKGGGEQVEIEKTYLKSCGTNRVGAKGGLSSNFCA